MAVTLWKFFNLKLNNSVTSCFNGAVRHGHRLRGVAPGVGKSLEQKLEESRYKDPSLYYRVDIGLPPPKVSRSQQLQERLQTLKAQKTNPSVVKLARNKECRYLSLVTLMQQHRFYTLLFKEATIIKQCWPYKLSTWIHNAKTTASFNYPKTRRDEAVVDDYFGTKVSDPYRWLEDPHSEETNAFVDAQNAITKPYLYGCIYKDKIKDKVTRHWNYPQYSIPSRHGNRYYQYRNTGLQNQSVIYVQKDLQSKAEVFLDPNSFSKDGTTAISNTAFTEDGKTFAYGVSYSGSDWVEIKFKDVKTGNHYKETLKKVKFSPMTWMHNNIGFFYGAYLDHKGKADGSETMSNDKQKLYYHTLGTEQVQDIMAVEFDDTQLRIGAIVSHCGEYLVITPTKGTKNNLLYFAKLSADKKITEKIQLTPVVTEFVADYHYVHNIGSQFFFRTNKDAKNYKIIAIDFNHVNGVPWVDVIPEHPKNVLYWAYVINTKMLVVCHLADVKNTLVIHDLETGKKIHDFNLDVGTVSAISGKYNHQQMFYSFCSFLTPNIIHQVDFKDGRIIDTVIHETKAADFDPSLFETKQVFYKSKDNTEVPMFVIQKKGQMNDGQKPCLLYGYGGFNISLTPAFSIVFLVFAKYFDGVCAIANIRGGGEYGDEWHKGGRLEKKQNCFDDFQWAAKYLVKENYTSVDKLSIMGGSNGGLLVAACINQAPELYGAAVCQVGVLDMLRYQKFTIGYAWSTEYGCADVKEQFDYLFRYSPLHNVTEPKEGQYPATLLVTADHDDRVVPLHSLKFIATLQHKIGTLSQQKNPLLIRVEKKAGHGSGKPTSKLIAEVTDYFCFISRALGLKFMLIDLEEVRQGSAATSAPHYIKSIADHYGVFEHLFGDAYFYPRVALNIVYGTEEHELPVFYGNILKPNDTKGVPKISYDSDKDSLWTLILTNPDGHFTEENKEYVHWFILNLPNRTFSTYDFYRELQDDITPSGLAFFQADWDSSLKDFYHNTLQMKEPIFEYDFPPPFIRKQEWFPLKRPFNLYMDKYRDPKQINKEFLMRKMKHVHPFKEPPPPLPYPNAQYFSGYVPSWLKLEMMKSRLKWGRINDIE
nr:unnamed protein product [Callosobruchus chinensis]